MKAVSLLTCLLAAFACFGPRHDVRADVVPVNGLDGDVAIGERPAFEDEESPDPTGIDYLIDVAPGVEVHAFAVSTNSLGVPVSFREGWGAPTAVINAIEWDAGAFFQIGDNSYSTTTLGTFLSLFPHDLYVSLFYRAEMGLPLAHGDDNPQANWETDFASFKLLTNIVVATTDFVALGANGQIVDRSFIAIVPEAHAWLLMAAAAASLIAARSVGHWLRQCP